MDELKTNPADEASSEIQIGDLVEIVGRGHIHQIVKIDVGQTIHTHKGIIRAEDLLGKPFGSVIETHNGHRFCALQPALADLIKFIPRKTQILYPKDIGFLLLNLAIAPGQRVIEAGSGSGAMTIALANAVGETGKVYSYEAKEPFQQVAKQNVSRIGLESRVEFKVRNIEEGFDERNVDALFLDVPNAYDYLPQTKRALKSGGFFGSLLPTANQVSLLIEALEANRFGFIEVCEVMLRYYRADAAKFRPSDRMVGHTGYLIFGRSLVDTDPFYSEENLERLKKAIDDLNAGKGQRHDFIDEPDFYDDIRG